MHHPIPLPIQHTENTIKLVEPDIDYVGFSRDNENFLSLAQEQWEKCIQVKPYKICTEIQQIYHRAGYKLCVVLLITDHKSSPNNCKLKFVSLNTPI